MSVVNGLTSVFQLRSNSPDYVNRRNGSRTHALLHPTGTILPGFMMLSGSSARLIAAIAAIAGAPSSAGRYFILPSPMPVSKRLKSWPHLTPTGSSIGRCRRSVSSPRT